jgi:hypothetical protein
VLARLAELYECDAADLVADWAAHRLDDPVAAAPVAASDAEPEALAWQVDNLALPQLTRALDDWSERLPEPGRRSLLLKLSTAAALAAASHTGGPAQPRTAQANLLDAMAGRWQSAYTIDTVEALEAALRTEMDL